MSKEINGVEEIALSYRRISVNKSRRHMRIENHHLNSIVIIVAGKIHQWIISGLKSEAKDICIISNYLLQYIYNKGKIVILITLSWRNPVDITVAKWPRLTSPVMIHTHITFSLIQCRELHVISPVVFLPAMHSFSLIIRN